MGESPLFHGSLLGDFGLVTPLSKAPHRIVVTIKWMREWWKLLWVLIGEKAGQK